MCEAVLILSVLFQIVAAALAIRLIRVTGRRTAWILIAAGMVLMAVRRIVPLWMFLTGHMEDHVHLNELAGLILSMLMAGGLALIRPFFLASRTSDELVRRGEEKYRTVFEHTGTAMLISEEDTTISLVNREFLKLSGFKVTEIVGRKWPEIIAEEDRRRLLEYHRLRRRDTAAVPAEYECRAVIKGGVVRHVHVVVSMIPETSRSIVSIIDITERKQAEEALFDSRQMLQLVLDNIPQRIFWKDRNCVYLGCNKPLARDTGYSEPADVIGKTDYETASSAIADRYRADDQQVMESGVPKLNYEEPQVRADGSPAWLRTSKVPLRDKSGRVIAVLGMYEDITERKRAESALAESHSLLSAALESTADGILVVDIGGKVTSFNQKFLDLWRIPADLAAARDDERLIRFVIDQLEEPDAFVAKVKELYHTPRASSWDELRFRDGRVFERYSQPQHLGDDVVGRVWSFRDVSERKRAEQALQEQEERYRSLVETAPDGIAIVVDDRIAFVNTEGAVILGAIDPATLVQRPIEDFVSPDAMDVFLPAYRQLWQNRDGASLLETNVRRLDGVTLPVEATATVFTYQGRPALQVVFRDITERKRAEAQIKRSEQKYRELYENLRDGSATVDMQGRITDCNHVFCEMLGYTEEEIKKLSYRDITPEKWHAEESRILEKEVLQRGYSNLYEKEYRRKDGAVLPVELRTYLARDAGGRPVGMWATVRDITERKLAEQREINLHVRLARSHRMESLGVLAGGVAHDLNNILGPIVAYPELILESIPADSTICGDLLEIKDAAQRAAAIIQDLLTLARRGAYQTHPVSLCELVDSYLRSAGMKELTGRCPEVKVSHALPDSRLLVMGSIPHLSQVLMNLVINAFEAMPHGGNIEVACSRVSLSEPLSGYEHVPEGDYAVLRVSDNGPGIERSDIEHIFEPFFTKKKMGHSGTGLGLAVVYGVTKDLGGFIDVRTELGRGTSFEIYFPVAEEGERPADVVTRDIRGTETILIVDDMESQRALADRVLSGLGYRVMAAASGQAALELLKTQTVDLVLLDMIMMDGFDGLDTYVRIRDEHPGLKCVLVSGFSESERVREAQRLGAGRFLQKPYTREQVGRAVREVLD